MDAKQEEHIEKAIVQTLEGYYEAARQCDARKFMSFFVDTDEMTVIENDEIRPSRKVFEEWIHEFFKGVVKLDVTGEDRRVFPLSFDVAVATGVFRYSAQTTSGELIGGRNAFTFVFVKKGERWQIKNVHESSLPVETTA
jgi:ketosteroid isomerase-like protein